MISVGNIFTSISVLSLPELKSVVLRFICEVGVYLFKFGLFPKKKNWNYLAFILAAALRIFWKKLAETKRKIRNEEIKTRKSKERKTLRQSQNHSTHGIGNAPTFPLNWSHKQKDVYQVAQGKMYFFLLIVVNRKWIGICWLKIKSQCR